MISNPWEPPDPRSSSLGALFLRAAFDERLLARFQLHRARAILRHFAGLGCAISAKLAAVAVTRDINELKHALSSAPRRRRVSDEGPALVCSPERTLRTITTSGSSGMPLAYGISAGWRRAHHVTWRLAYLLATEGALDGYLDRRLTWAMARPPGGTRDDLSNTIEILPAVGGLALSRPPDQVQPHVVHGSVTTIIEALELPAVAAWRPALVFLTYEGASELQRRILVQAWPTAKIHVEYAANDGGISAFTCSRGRLHAWTMRALVSETSGPACVLDLFNDATSFVAYENGDELDFANERCPCGSVLPVVALRGRQAAQIRFADGRTLSALCPFSSEELRGLRGIRVEILDEQRCRLVLVRSWKEDVDPSALARRMHAQGLLDCELTWLDSVVALRDSGKFRTVVDLRHRRART